MGAITVEYSQLQTNSASHRSSSATQQRAVHTQVQSETMTLIRCRVFALGMAEVGCQLELAICVVELNFLGGRIEALYACTQVQLPANIPEHSPHSAAPRRVEQSRFQSSCVV